MMLIIFVLFLFISSFILFVLGRHDFVLLRQNISLRLIFDRALVSISIALLLARIGYVVDFKLYDFLVDPLRFLHLIIYWGINFLIFFVAYSGTIFLFFRKRKNIFRILDIYLLASFPLIVFQILNYTILGEFSLLYGAGATILVLVIFLYTLRKHTTFKLKDGLSTCVMLLTVSGVYLAHSFTSVDKITIHSPIQIIAGVTIAVALYVFFLIKFNFFKEK